MFVLYSVDNFGFFITLPSEQCPCMMERYIGGTFTSSSFGKLFFQHTGTPIDQQCIRLDSLDEDQEEQISDEPKKRVSVCLSVYFVFQTHPSNACNVAAPLRLVTIRLNKTTPSCAKFNGRRQTQIGTTYKHSGDQPAPEHGAFPCPKSINQIKQQQQQQQRQTTQTESTQKTR